MNQNYQKAKTWKAWRDITIPLRKGGITNGYANFIPLILRDTDAGSADSKDKLIEDWY